MTTSPGGELFDSPLPGPASAAHSERMTAAVRERAAQSWIELLGGRRVDAVPTTPLPRDGGLPGQVVARQRDSPS